LGTVERGIEYEHLGAATDLGLGLQPWSPLAGGFLTGKYRRDDPANITGQRGPALPDGKPAPAGDHGRLSGANPFGDSKFTDRNWDILAAVHAVASERGATPGQVALAWLAGRPGVASILIGASRADQVADNIAALQVALSDEQRRRLDAASAPPPIAPFALQSEFVKRFAFGGNDVRGWR
jgi:aryl-alcohol dehydrogenase-like predicted oxidoreductase